MQTTMSSPAGTFVRLFPIFIGKYRLSENIGYRKISEISENPINIGNPIIYRKTRYLSKYWKYRKYRPIKISADIFRYFRYFRWPDISETRYIGIGSKPDISYRYRVLDPIPILDQPCHSQTTFLKILIPNCLGRSQKVFAFANLEF